MIAPPFSPCIDDDHVGKAIVDMQKLSKCGGKPVICTQLNSGMFIPPEEIVVRCMDEGLLNGGIAAAGALTLFPHEEAAYFIKSSGAIGTSSHSGCAAARQYLLHKKVLRDGELLEPSVLDDFAFEIAKRKAENHKLGKVAHYTQDEMSRPADRHVAIVIYYVGVPYFDPSKAPNLPPGFLISRRHFLKPKTAIAQTKMAAEIALCPNFGLRSQFIQERAKLLLVAVGCTNDLRFSKEILTKELEAAANNDPLIKIFGFDVPKYLL